MRQIVVRRASLPVVRRAPLRIVRRPVRRGMGQSPSVSPLPTCASLDMAQTVPQGVLIAGGGLATLVGVVGAIFSDEYRKDFAIAAGAGLVASFIGGLWAVNTISTQLLSPPCTGPGLAALGAGSVNPDQTTPTGMQPGLFGPSTPIAPAQVTQPSAANPQITNPAL
jgi:hypothetical protein